MGYLNRFALRMAKECNVGSLLSSFDNKKDWNEFRDERLLQ